MTCPTDADRTRSGSAITRTGPRAALHRFVIVAAVAAMALLVAPRRAAAAPKVACTVLEIEASSTDKPSVDAELKPLEKKLRKPPFSSWNTFKQLGAHQLDLELMKAGELTLHHGKASLILRDLTIGTAKKARVSLGITLDDATGKRVLDSKVAVDAGDYIVVGRSLKGNRGHLVALRCQP